jgi:hypothetical protein
VRTPLRALAIVSIAAVSLCAQEKTAVKEPEKEEEPRVEAEFVASDIFRSGTTIITVWRGLRLEGEYFGAPPYDVGITGAAWNFRWKGLSLAPGLAVGFGSRVDVSPILTFRWVLKTRRWFSQGFVAQSLTGHVVEQETEGTQEGGEPAAPQTRDVHASILDNNHISVRLGLFEIGGMWERIRYREEKEWKGGLRVGARIWKGVTLIFQTVGPDVEYRGGIAFER